MICIGLHRIRMCSVAGFVTNGVKPLISVTRELIYMYSYISRHSRVNCCCFQLPESWSAVALGTEPAEVWGHPGR